MSFSMIPSLSLTSNHYRDRLSISVTKTNIIVFTARCTQCKARYCYRKSSVRPSVCPSVRLSVTLTYREHIGWTSWKLITRIISLGSSLLGATPSAIQSEWNTPKIRVEQGWGSSQQESCNISETGLRGKIGPRLLLLINRKSHTRFRLVLKSTTLDDLEGPLRIVFQNTCVFRSPPRKLE